jgi:hypothetical protein
LTAKVRDILSCLRKTAGSWRGHEATTDSIGI